MWDHPALMLALELSKSITYSIGWLQGTCLCNRQCQGCAVYFAGACSSAVLQMRPDFCTWVIPRLAGQVMVCDSHCCKLLIILGWGGYAGKRRQTSLRNLAP